MTLENIRLLRSVLNDSLEQLEKLYTSKSLNFPALDEAYVENEEQFLTSDPEAIQAINITVSAAYQLLLTVRHPFISLSDAANAYHLSACLRVAEKFNVVEILRKYGADGCHVKFIADQCRSEPFKLARILRVLATHHIFREITPNVFANNRISSYLDTGKPSESLFQDPEKKYIGTAGAAGYVGTFTDDVFKASSYLLENLEDPVFGKEYLADRTALQKAFPTDKTYFSWLEDPGNRNKLDRYAACIRGTSLWDTPEAILQGFDWASLNPDSLVVDVGGGTGVPAMLVARSHSHLRIVIQEREPIVIQGTEYWNSVFPEALSSGKVSFQTHDFFEPQPLTNVSVFLVRTICHDWPDVEVVKILTNLRKVATQSTKLLLADFIIPYACPSTTVNPVVPSAADTVVPRPLLANLGKATANAYWIDMTMQVLLNGQERTLLHQIEIAAQAGWHVVRVHLVDNSQFGYIVAEPV